MTRPPDGDELLNRGPETWTGHEGRFEHSDGTGLVVSTFTVTEVEEGFTIEAVVPSARALGPIVLGSATPDRFVGQLADDRQLRCVGTFVLDTIGTRGDGPGLRAVYRCLAGDGLTITTPPGDPGAGELTVSFELVNLMFTPLTTTEHVLPPAAAAELGIARTVRRDVLELEVDGRPIRLRQALNYAALVRHLRSAGGHASTARLEGLTAHSHAAIDADLRPFVDGLCEVLTLATAAHVTWKSWRACGPSGDFAGTAARMGQSTRYAGARALIDSSKPEELRAFVARAFPAYQARREAFELLAVVHAYTVGLAGEFLESKALQLCSLAEFLCDRTIAHAGLDPMYLPEAAAAAIRTELQRATKAFVDAERQADRLTKAQRDDVMSALPQQLRAVAAPGFKRRLKLASGQLAAGLTADDLKQFVDTRNALVHAMRFDPEQRADKRSQYEHVRYVVDRLLLGLLEYRGWFIDCRDYQRRQFPAEE